MLLNGANYDSDNVDFHSILCRQEQANLVIQQRKSAQRSKFVMPLNAFAGACCSFVPALHKSVDLEGRTVYSKPILLRQSATEQFSAGGQVLPIPKGALQASYIAAMSSYLSCVR